MKQHDKRFEAYARLVVEVGSNVQAGVPVWIQASVETAPFVRLVTRYAYEKGASEVLVDWSDDTLRRLRLEHAPMEVLETVPDFLYERREYYCKKGTHMIHLISADPEALTGRSRSRTEGIHGDESQVSAVASLHHER